MKHWTLSCYTHTIHLLPAVSFNVITQKQTKWQFHWKCLGENLLSKCLFHNIVWILCQKMASKLIQCTPLFFNIIFYHSFYCLVQLYDSTLFTPLILSTPCFHFETLQCLNAMFKFKAFLLKVQSHLRCTQCMNHT